MSQKIDEIGLYQVKGNAGNVGTPGAPVFQFSLLVNAASGAVTGQGVITQALKGPESRINLGAITGHVQASGFGEYTRLVSLSASAVISFPPPAIGSYTVPFTAHFAVNDGWNGKGGWTLGQDTVNNVPVRST